MTETVTVRRDDLRAVMGAAGAAACHPECIPGIAEAWERLTEAKGDPEATPNAASMPEGGQFMFIAFAGHSELTGYVTEITIGGEPAFHVDLPEKLWGGNPLAWEEYSAKFLFSRRPLTQESVRAAWDETVRRAGERRRWQEEWQRERAAIAAGDGEDGDDADELPF